MLPPTRQEKKLWDIIELNYGKWIDKSERNESAANPIYGANGILSYTEKFLYEWDSIIVWRKWSAGALTKTSGKFWPSDVTYYVTTKKDVDMDYLFYGLQILNIPSLAQWVKPWINRNDVYDLKIPLPPLATQKLIVEKLDAAMQGIDNSIALLDQNLAECDALWQSSLSESFTGDWEEKKLNDIFDVRDGTHDSPKFHNEWFPLVTSKNLKEGLLELSNIKYISETDYIAINQRSKVDKWDLLFAMIGTIWNPIIIQEEPNFAIKNVALFKYKNWECIVEYLKYYLSQTMIINKMASESKWATQKFVSLWYLRNFLIPLPPLEQQETIVAHLDQIAAHIDSLRSSYQIKKEQLLELKASVLHDAFAGKLVG
jgi:type I restriction enzyme S subunit